MINTVAFYKRLKSVPAPEAIKMLIGLNEETGSTFNPKALYKRIMEEPKNSYAIGILSEAAGNTLESPLPRLDTPTLTATTSTAVKIDLSWPDITDADSYILLRSLQEAIGYTVIDTPAAGETTYSDTGLTPSTQYYYKIIALGDYTAFANSYYSIDSDTTSDPVVLSTPVLTLTVDSATEITGDWTNVANETGYTFEIAEDEDFNTGLQSFDTAVNVVTHQFTGLTTSTLYHGRVLAKGDGIGYLDSEYGEDTATTS